MWRNVIRWNGIILVAVTIVSSLWLAVTGQLVLYIHPRYVIFTVTMAIIGLAFVLASFAMRADPGGDDDHDHDHDHGVGSDPLAELDPTLTGQDASSPARRRAALFATLGTALTLVIAFTLIVLPPATLSSATAGQRSINSTGVGSEIQSVDDAATATDGAFSAFTVLDWASLLRQTTDTSFYAEKPASMVGFIADHPDDSDNMFYLTRFVVTCCAVDAQPVGVPVYLENWRAEFAIDDWVQVDGEFGTNPSRASTEPIVLTVDDMVPVEQPAEPYLW
ncbi:TIGR03943 family putative permease subunit [Marisediminicola senii]|uniref:TIGR03943 family putative permease subunit n=1 Tax=Marisediminicola senii TaxID=2711233 RepID=UPI0013ECC872|nr:TIGR03943 family protein [Marisediminicola senii]